MKSIKPQGLNQGFTVYMLYMSECQARHCLHNTKLNSYWSLNQWSELLGLTIIPQHPIIKRENTNLHWLCGPSQEDHCARSPLNVQLFFCSGMTSWTSMPVTDCQLYWMNINNPEHHWWVMRMKRFLCDWKDVHNVAFNWTTILLHLQNLLFFLLILYYM